MRTAYFIALILLGKIKINENGFQLVSKGVGLLGRKHVHGSIDDKGPCGFTAVMITMIGMMIVMDDDNVDEC